MNWWADDWMRIRIRIPIRMLKNFSVSEKPEIYVTISFSFFFRKRGFWIRDFTFYYVKKKKKKKIMPQSRVSKVEKLAAPWKTVR